MTLKKYIASGLIITLVSPNFSTLKIFAESTDKKNNTSYYKSNDEIFIEDLNLENEIRNKLGIFDRELTKADMESLTTLSCFDKNIKSLSGLEYAINLQGIILDNNNIEDVTPLKGLTNLSYLHLANNNISDISCLSSLVNLNTLGISNNNITDIDVLKNLQNLDFLNISENKVGNLNSIRGLIGLKTLLASNCGIYNIESLSNLSLLEYVNLSRNNIMDISSLNTENITDLDLYDNNIEDVSCLSNNTNLQRLVLSDNNIITIDNLKNMTSLEGLNLSNNNIKSLGDLTSLENIKYINLDGNSISDISNMKLPYSVENINLAQNNLESLSGFENNTEGNLNNISIDNNKISDLSPLSNIKKLKFLNAGINKISDLSPLSNLNRLQSLDIHENCVKDLRPLSGLLRLSQTDGLTAYNQNIKLDDVTIDNGSSYTFAVDDIYDMNGSKLNINSIYITDRNTNTIDGIFDDSSITINNVVKDVSVLGYFNSDIFNGTISQNVNVNSKPVEEVIDFNGIEIENKNPILNDNVKISVDINGKESEISSIDLYYNENGINNGEYRTVTLSQRDNGKLVGTVYANEVGYWGLNSMHIKLDNGQEYKITRESNEKIQQGDFNVKDGTTEIIIPDSSLEYAIKKQLGLYSGEPITEDNIRYLTNLNINGNQSIKSLEGLDQAINLEDLSISTNNDEDITNLDVIGKLSKLKKLTIYQDKLGDLNFLSNLSNLEYLDILGEGNIDINNLSKCDKLNLLRITKTNIINLDSLKDKSLLKELYLSHIKDINLNSVSKLNYLISLSIRECNIEDISRLGNMTSLESLMLSKNNIKDISSLKNLTKLQSLYLEENKISDINVLSNLTNLETLNIYNNNVSEIPKSLLNLENLRYIHAQEQRINNEIVETNSNNVSIENPVSLFGEKVSEFSSDNNEEFKVNGNNLEWSNVTNSKVLYGRFDKSLKVNKIRVYFTGLVSQPVEYNSLPVINANDIEVRLGDVFEPKNNVDATDKEEGNLKDSIEVIENTVNTKKPGTYKVTYKVTDKKGASDTKTINVKVLNEFLDFTVNNVNSRDTEITGKGLSGSKVEAFIGNDKIGQAIVDSSGKYKISSLYLDFYNTNIVVKISKDGYYTKKKTIKIAPIAVSNKKTLSNDIYKYDAGKGKYLTYINGKGYSQYVYLNKSGKYAFTPSSWMVAAGLTVSMPTNMNGNTMMIDNSYIDLYNNAKAILDKLKTNKISTNEARISLNNLEQKYQGIERNNMNDLSRATVKKNLTTDIYKHDAGKGGYLTYINGKAYSQYVYLNKSGKYAFTPSSWMLAAGLEVSMPTSSNNYTMKINNPYIAKYNNLVKEIKSYISSN